jgi:hypothetical protein
MQLPVQAPPEHVSPSNSRWLDYSVWTVALWASLLNLLNFNQYPLFRPEVGIALLGLALIGMLMGMTQHVARPGLAFVFAGLFAAVMIDLNASIELGWFYALWAVLAMIGFFALNTLLKLTLAAFAAVFLFQLATLTMGIGASVPDENKAKNLQTGNGEANGRPAIVHLLLDSYLGLDGMALGPGIYRDLGAEQAAFFVDEGFQVYPRAYSRHTRTMTSLPYLFSYGEAPPVVHSISPQYAVPEELPYFIDLDERGYRISAVLPAYFDLCVKQKLTHCRTFESSALTSMLGTELSAFDRAKVFGFTLLKLTYVPTRVAFAMQLGANDLLATEGRWPFNRSELYPLSSIREFDRFTDDLADLQRGEVRFAHLLLPHSPFGLGADCKVKPEAAWLNEHGPGAEAEREKAYADQVRCLQLRVGRMLDMLNGTRAGREALVLVHGDHGSRIAPAQPYLGGPELSQRQMLMSHSTFFAIRVPGEAAGEVAGTHALDDLMADFSARDFASAPRPRDAAAEVWFMDAAGAPHERHPLPSFER